MDRRKEERYDLQVPIQVSLRRLFPGQVPKLVFRTRDISSHGAFLYTDESLGRGSRVNIDVYLSFDKLRRIFGTDRFLIVNLNGRVIRIENEGIAVQFDQRYRMRAA